MTKLFRKIRAKLNNTFLADCPKCHKHFYGFDKHHVQVKIHNIHYRIVCDNCVQEEDKRNRKM